MREKTLGTFLLGGAGYCLLEVLYCGHTHWAMFWAGGVGFCGLLRLARLQAPLWVQAVLGGALLTVVELGFGVVFNLGLGLDLWDYRPHRGDLWGQICPLYAALWVVLSGVVIAAARLYRGTLKLPLRPPVE